VLVWLELGEWLAEIGWVLSIAGMVSIESPLAHSKTELKERRGLVSFPDRPFKSWNSMANVQETR